MTKTFNDILFSAKLVREPIKAKSESWQETAYQWLCDFRYEGGFFTVDYYTGSGLVTKKGERIIPKKPEIKDVLYSLWSDSQACNQSFDDWCSDYGYSNNSISAFNTYQECCKSGIKLRKLGLSHEYLEKEFENF